MKKITALIASLILALGICIIPASAAGAGKITAANAAGKQGDTVTVDVGIASNPGLITFRISVSYDSDLELTDVSDSKLLSGWTTPSPTISSPYTLRWADSLSTTNNSANGRIVTLSFKIKDGAAVGNKTVTVKFIESRGADGGKNTFSDATATVSVTCRSHSYGSWAKVNDGSHKRTCSACGHEETGSHTWNGGTVTKPATCKEAGNRKYTCTACGAEKSETIPKGTTHSWGSFKVTKQPTCTAPGTQTRTCSVCGATDTATVNATGHSMGSWTTTKAPTCTAAGEQTRSCSKCSHKETKTVNALGHSFSSPTVTKQPTCTSAGEETGKCTRCGATTSQSIAPTGHSFGAWYDDTAATCTEGGIMKRVCTKCNAAETRSTDALGHDFENPTIVKEATISEPGLKEGKCRRCGETTSEVIPCSAKDPATGTEFSADEGVFSAGTELKVEETAKDDPTFESVKNILKDVSGEFKLYDVSATLNGSDVQPNGKVKVKFAVPEGYGSNISVNVINADGTYRTVDSILSEDGSFITAELDTLGSIAICKLGASAGNDGSSDSSTNQPAGTSSQPDSKVKSGSHTWLIVLIVIVVVAAAGVGIFFVMKKKKA